MYFSIDKLKIVDALFYFITSGRGMGKTFNTVKYCIENNLEFVYLRRTDEEIKASAPKLLTPFQVNGYFTDNVLSYSKPSFYMDGKLIGHALSINTAASKKSISFENVKVVIFDEFIVETGRYLPQETDKFMNVIETIIRNRDDVRIFCLANNSTRFNPYYQLFKIEPSNSKNGVTHYKKMGVVIWNYENNVFKEHKTSTKWGKILVNTGYSGYMIDNKPFKDSYDYVDEMKGFVKTPFVNLIIDKTNIVGYYIQENGVYIMYFSTRTRIENIDTINYDKLFIENSSMSAISGNALTKQIKLFSSKNCVRFNDVPTKSLIESIIF